MKPQIKLNIPLAPLSTFGIGGNAKYFLEVKSPEELIAVAKRAEEEKVEFKVFAGGSNVVFPDEETHGLVIRVLGGNIAGNMRELIADSGVLLSDLIDRAIRSGLSGLESLSGIPGTVGGAVVGNAGAYGHSISEAVEKVEIWDGKKRKWINKEDCLFAYRESVFKKKPYLILRVKFKLKKSDASELKKFSKEVVELRQKKYKPGIRCPGSFFKNIMVHEIDEDQLINFDNKKIVYGKIPAGFLLEQVGAKGMKEGGIEIADFHGNLFINRGGGTAKDVKKLAEILKQRVKRKFGITLSEEIRYF